MTRSKAKMHLRRYWNSAMWLTLGIIAYIPSQLARSLLLRILGLRMSGATIYGGFHIRKPSKISIGEGTVIGHGVTLDGRNGIAIGENVNFSSEVMIWSMQHDYNAPDFCAIGGPVLIGDYAWISTRAIILPNVVIGEGAVVGAGALVTKDVDPYTVVGGVPARKIAERNKNLDYRPKDFGVLPFI